MNGRYLFPASVPQGRFAAALALSALMHLALGFLPLQDVRRSASPDTPVRDGLAATLRYADTAPSAPGPAEAQPVGGPATGRGAEPIPFPEETYYPTARLTKRPQPTTAIDLEGPSLRPVVASGKIALRLWIDRRGTVVDAEVEAAEMPPMFAAAAVSAFKQARFIPGELDGRPVGAVMRVEISYEDGRSPGP